MHPFALVESTPWVVLHSYSYTDGYNLHLRPHVKQEDNEAWQTPDTDSSQTQSYMCLHHQTHLFHLLASKSNARVELGKMLLSMEWSVVGAGVILGGTKLTGELRH